MRFPEIIAPIILAISAIFFRPRIGRVTKMENVPVAPFVNDAISKLDGQWNSFDVGRGNEKIELFDERRWLVLGGGFLGRRSLVHLRERFQKFAIHTLAVEERFFRFLHRETSVG